MSLNISVSDISNNFLLAVRISGSFSVQNSLKALNFFICKQINKENDNQPFPVGCENIDGNVYTINLQFTVSLWYNLLDFLVHMRIQIMFLWGTILPNSNKHHSRALSFSLGAAGKCIVCISSHNPAADLTLIYQWNTFQSSSYFINSHFPLGFQQQHMTC